MNEEYRGPNGLGFSDTELKSALIGIGLVLGIAASIAWVPQPWVYIPVCLLWIMFLGRVYLFWLYLRKTYFPPKRER